MKRCVAVLLLAVVLAGCASANKGTASGSSMSGMNMSGSSSTSKAGSVVGSSSSMAGMTMNSSGSGTATVVSASGVPTPVPIRTIGSGDWGQMEITAQTMTPVPFFIYNGTTEREVKPTKADSFHLMVMLTDKSTHVAIPYATVWATITNAKGKVVYDERQWPMLSEYMGPHYGDDVALPGPGKYHLSVLVSAPVAALHIEYAHMWTGAHRVNSEFTWKQ